MSAVQISKYLSGYPGTGFSIGKGVVVVLKMIATIFGDGVELMVGQLGKGASRSNAGAVERIIGIVHLVAAEDSFQTAFVETLVVSHQREPFYQRFNLSPDIRKHGCVFRIFARQAMHPGVPVGVIVRLGLDERIERVYYLAVPHNDHAHTAHAGALVIGRLEIYGCKVSHLSRCFACKVTKRFAKKLHSFENKLKRK